MEKRTEPARNILGWPFGLTRGFLSLRIWHLGKGIWILRTDGLGYRAGPSALRLLQRHKGIRVTNETPNEIIKLYLNRSFISGLSALVKVQPKKDRPIKIPYLIALADLQAFLSRAMCPP